MDHLHKAGDDIERNGGECWTMKVEIVRHLYRDFDKKELGVWAQKIISIPFGPYPDLVIYDGYESMKIEHVRYDSTRKKAACLVVCHWHDDYENEKQILIDSGWKFTNEVEPGRIVENIESVFFY